MKPYHLVYFSDSSYICRADVNWIAHNTYELTLSAYKMYVFSTKHARGWSINFSTIWPIFELKRNDLYKSFRIVGPSVISFYEDSCTYNTIITYYNYINYKIYITTSNSLLFRPLT